MPRRSLDSYDKAFAEALSRELRREGSDIVLRPKQAAMLVEAVEAGGIFGMLGVGYGKSWCAPLFGKVMDVAPVVLLVPPSIKQEMLTRVIPFLQRHIDFIPPFVVSYSELSTVKGADILDRIKPALIVADEAHMLKNKGAARTKRFVRYFTENPTTLFVALSGTMTRKSLMDFHHIITITHKGWKCPVTRHWRDAKDWALALDPQVPEDQRMAPGALLELARPGEDARAGFRRRLIDTDGVVGGSAEDVGASLVFRTIAPEVPAGVLAALASLRSKWETPGGEYVTDALDYSRKATELAQGFYYVWDWPKGVQDDEWLDARKAWRQAVGSVCKLGREGLDSELLVRNAAAREAGHRDTTGVVASSDAARLPKSMREDVVAAWKAWEAVKDREEPDTRAIWIDDFAVKAALQWAKDAEANGNGGIVWYNARAVGERAALLGGLVCGAGVEGNRRMLSLSEGDRAGAAPSVFASSNAHGTGKNLQRWNRCLVIAPWSGGATWEQTIGRCHRPGQEADEVTVEIFAHTPELQRSIDTAKEQALYIAEVTGGQQKMLQGTWIEGRDNGGVFSADEGAE